MEVPGASEVVKGGFVTYQSVAKTMLLDVPADEDIVMGIALGYAAEDDINAFASSRLPLEDILSVKQ